MSYQPPNDQPTWSQLPPYPSPQPPKKSRRRLWIILSIVGGVLIFSCVMCSVAAAFTPKASQTPQVSTLITATAATTPTQNPTATDTPTPQPSPTATPTAKPTQLAVKPTPTHAAPTPTPKPHCVGVNNNPWCFDFSPGKLIYIPPSGFCGYFNCIPSFYGSDDPGDGFIIECQDTTFSQSGGESGACSHHGGELRPLYSH